MHVYWHACMHLVFHYSVIPNKISRKAMLKFVCSGIITSVGKVREPQLSHSTHEEVLSTVA